MFQCQPTARYHETGVTARNRHRDSGRYEGATTTCRQNDVDSGMQIKTRIIGVGFGGQWQLIIESHDGYDER